jgi:hypothetical protein
MSNSMVAVDRIVVTPDLSRLHGTRSVLGRLVVTAFFVIATLFIACDLRAQNTPKTTTPAEIKTTNGSSTPKDISGNTEQAKSVDEKASSSKSGQIDEVDSTKGTIAVTPCDPDCNGAPLKLTTTTERHNTLQGLRKEDRVSYSADSQSVIQTIKLIGRPVSKSERFLVLGCSVLLCLLVTALLTWWHPLRLIIGEDGRYSNSKFQMSIWFCLVIASYLSVVYLRLTQIGWEFFGNVNIPNNLLLISGMSALTFAGAKGITTAKVDDAHAQGNADPKPAGRAQFLQNLVQNDLGAFDLGDFQMLVVTLLAVGMFAISVFHFLGLIETKNPTSLPDIDTTILAAFGLGQGAYLTKKAVGKVASS